MQVIRTLDRIELSKIELTDAIENYIRLKLHRTIKRDSVRVFVDNGDVRMCKIDLLNPTEGEI